MEDLIQLQSKMIDVNQKQLTNLQIGEFLVEIISFLLVSYTKNGYFIEKIHLGEDLYQNNVS